MKATPSSSPSEESLDTIEQIVEKFDFSKDNLQAYINEAGRWTLTAETLQIEKKYKDIKENSTLQDKMLEATFKSKIYPDIIGISTIDFSKLAYIQQEEKDAESFTKRIYSRLASSGHSDLEKKELAYMSALTKEEIISDKFEWLEKNNVKVEKVSISRMYWQKYLYTITLRDIDDNMPWNNRWDSIDEALEKSLKELRRSQESNKKWEKELWERSPEFMYLRGEYKDQFAKLGFHISIRDNNPQKNDYGLWLSYKGHFDTVIHIRGESWESVFKKALTEANIKADQDKKDNEWWLNITSFSNDDILDLFGWPKDHMHMRYQHILQKKVEDALDAKEVPPVKDEELIVIKNKCIEDENYELAAKISSYLNRKE